MDWNFQESSEQNLLAHMLPSFSKYNTIWCDVFSLEYGGSMTPLSLMCHTPSDINLWLIMTHTFIFWSISQIPFVCLMVLFEHQNWWRLWDAEAMKFHEQEVTWRQVVPLSKCKKRKLRKLQDTVIRVEWVFLCCIGGQSQHNRGNIIHESPHGPAVPSVC